MPSVAERVSVSDPSLSLIPDSMAMPPSAANIAMLGTLEGISQPLIHLIYDVHRYCLRMQTATREASWYFTPL